MYPATFEYHRATSVDDALGLLQKYGEDGKLIAGGHSLLPLMKLRLATPGHLIDIRRIAGLSGVRENGGGVIVGATTTHAEVAASAFVRGKLPLLAEAAGGIGDPLVRNMGTIGGSLAHADPKADYPAVILALRAHVVAVGKAGKEDIESDKTFTGMFTTALKAGELITEVHFPVSGNGNGGAYEKLADPASGYATVGVAAQLRVDKGKIVSAGVALTGLGPTATRLGPVEKALTGQPATPDTVRAAAQQAGQGYSGYQANLAVVYTERALLRALARATG